MLMNPYCGTKQYEPKDKVYLKNPEQSARFAKYIYLYDVILSGDRFAFVFKKDEAEPLLTKWRNFDLK